LVALPDAFTVGRFAFDASSPSAQSLLGTVLSRIRDVAIEHGLPVLAGNPVEDLTNRRWAPAPPDSSVANCRPRQSSPAVLMSAESPWAISMSFALLSVQAVRSVTASMASRACGGPVPDRLTPPNGSCTSAPMQGRLA